MSTKASGGLIELLRFSDSSTSSHSVLGTKHDSTHVIAGRLRPRSHYSVFVSIRFCCIEATVHTAPFLYKKGVKNIRFCAFTLLRFSEAHCWILESFQKPPFLCVHIDQMRFQKPPFLWISTFDSVFENLRFCGVFMRISVSTFTKTEVFLSVFVENRSSVNGALAS